MCQVRVGRVQLAPAVGEKGMQLVATFGSPLMAFSISFIHQKSFQGTVWSTWSTKESPKMMETNLSFCYIKNLLFQVSMVVPLWVFLWFWHGFLMILAWLSLWDQLTQQHINNALRQLATHPPTHLQAATASTCRTTDFKASTFAPEVTEVDIGYLEPTAWSIIPSC